MGNPRFRRVVGALLLCTLSSPGWAGLVTYGYFGVVGEQRIADLPVALIEPVGGFLRYNPDAEVLSDLGSTRRYFDPDGLLAASFNNISMIGLGLEIAITRIDLGPIFRMNRIDFRTDTVLVDGSTVPIDYMTLQFFGFPDGIPDFEIPVVINELLNTRLFVASPDIPPSSGPEPPRSGYLTSSRTTFFPVATVPLPATPGLLLGSLLVLAVFRVRAR